MPLRSVTHRNKNYLCYMKNLIIDIGNTQAKIYVVEGQQVTHYCVHPDASVEVVQTLVAQYETKNSIVSSTRDFNPMLDEYLCANMGCHIWFNPATTPVPIKNLYQTPETLGADRLAAAVGAMPYVEKYQAAAMIFDFGTAITIDHVSQNAEFCGGNISLGYSMRLVALHKMTARLPLITPPQYENQLNENLHRAFGTSTNMAMLNGVRNSVEFEIEGYCEKNLEKIKIFTGGEAFYFANNSKYAIFADYELVPKGLNRILEYNAH